ncbi:hypothetical protein QBC34DRAFT_471610 [Podospora aff. communis PSN243]|uniref:Uncharacterized protein n=1 Tax=Podospora aff. communis PSN243 TaxID=3040156 RepID=A0AAV9GED1_9PEZI|nr:hypothetical protein QBC34DRAFT_471610 [Podospora aff. communis PSN243]
MADTGEMELKPDETNSTTPDEMDKVKPTAVHWKTPVTMLLGLVAGALFAVGHHIFYRDLDGKAVSDASYDQQMNIRIGTGLSYLVRAALVIAIGAAYFQLFWRTLLRTAVPLAAVDSLADLLGSPLSFFDLAALRANPFLFFIAAVSWLVPFATIVPPATLTILSVPIESYVMHPMAAIDFATAPMAALSYISSRAGPHMGTNSSAFSTPWYDGASQPLSRLALATAMHGAVPNIPSPAENSSYRLHFDAPAVKCEKISVDILNGFIPVMGCPVINDGNYSTQECGASYYYMAWPPSSDSIIPFGNGSIAYGRGPWVLDSNVGSFGPYGHEPASVFVAVDTEPPYGEDMIVLNCSLWNSTYTVDYNFPVDGQRITVADTRYTHPVSVGLLDSFPDVFLDLSIYGPPLNGTDGRPHETGAFLQTDLAYSAELFPTYKLSIVTSDKQAYNITVAQAMVSPNFGRPLSTLIEEMFQNMTLALFSQQVFLRDGALMTNVTIRSTQNEYSYEPSRLLLAYGLAIGFTLVIVVLGIGSLWLSGASYSNKFSTVMRTTCDPDMCATVASVDRTGADPLPEYLETLKVRAGTGSALPTDRELLESPSLPAEQKQRPVSSGDSGVSSPEFGREVGVPADNPSSGAEPRDERNMHHQTPERGRSSLSHDTISTRRTPSPQGVPV